MTLLALDAGGTSTRAVALTPAGDVLGYGRGPAGNPTAAGIGPAAESIGAAAGVALRTAGSAEVAVVAMAGEQTDAFRTEVTERLAAYGVTRVVLEHDLLALYCSGTPAPDGYALIAGTGTVAARVVGGGLAAVVGGRGWLLGDAGGGFWIGRRVARAVVAALDGQAPPTALTPLVLAALGIDMRTADPEDPVARAALVRQLVSSVYARRPVALAELAPLAFAVPNDPAARSIVVAASRALADLVDAVRVPELAGPVVVGGSVVVRGILGAPESLAADLVPPAGETPVVPVPDGLVGAAVLALRHTGHAVDEATFLRLQERVLAYALRASA
ncbi:N-acetylglucosamine kinase [Microlunatus antarcticus]|uniref:N-acetylglucosamine kinase-like BadF-type ATPase n=1 Tax=Microlunatus antarcticus TaxID=53388 RepID=A0A7W5P9H5_9ACTN|nr:BadF/BadG/BcrA/BcrD ATPase family protein [Microlunatus antarcticus]MBB3328941.1 N-acetylglucosamine kinase-like BadF-type ATPase [Microlunatus antarcticus]